MSSTYFVLYSLTNQNDVVRLFSSWGQMIMHTVLLQGMINGAVNDARALDIRQNSLYFMKSIIFWSVDRYFSWLIFDLVDISLDWYFIWLIFILIDISFDWYCIWVIFDLINIWFDWYLIWLIFNLIDISFGWYLIWLIFRLIDISFNERASLRRGLVNIERFMEGLNLIKRTD